VRGGAQVGHRLAGGWRSALNLLRNRHLVGGKHGKDTAVAAESAPFRPAGWDTVSRYRWMNVYWLAKSPYWRDVFERFGQSRLHERFFSSPRQRMNPALRYWLHRRRGACGSSGPNLRLGARAFGRAARVCRESAVLFEARSNSKAGVGKMRTMVAGTIGSICHSSAAKE
jgi:hypothetical protein